MGGGCGRGRSTISCTKGAISSSDGSVDTLLRLVGHAGDEVGLVAAGAESCVGGLEGRVVGGGRMVVEPVRTGTERRGTCSRSFCSRCSCCSRSCPGTRRSRRTNRIMVDLVRVRCRDFPWVVGEPRRLRSYKHTHNMISRVNVPPDTRRHPTPDTARRPLPCTYIWC